MGLIYKNTWHRKFLILLGIYLGIALLLFVYLLEGKLYEMERIQVFSAMEMEGMDQWIIKPLDVFIHDMNLMIFPYVFFGILCLLPAIKLYQYYMGEKSILTILRLPGRWTKALFYWNLMKDTVLSAILMWIGQFLLLILCGLYFHWRVPVEDRIGNQWGMLWDNIQVSSLYPLQNPWEIIMIGSMLVLIPSMVILLVLAERSRRQGILAILGIGVGIYAMYLYYIRVYFGIFLIPGITLLVIGLGIYYLYRKEIV